MQGLLISGYMYNFPPIKKSRRCGGDVVLRSAGQLQCPAVDSDRNSTDLEENSLFSISK